MDVPAFPQKQELRNSSGWRTYVVFLQKDDSHEWVEVGKNAGTWDN